MNSSGDITMCAVPSRQGVSTAGGFTMLGEWWRVGFVMSVVLVWLVVGGAWWALLGYW